MTSFLSFLRDHSLVDVIDSNLGVLPELLAKGGRTEDPSSLLDDLLDKGFIALLALDSEDHINEVVGVVLRRLSVRTYQVARHLNTRHRVVARLDLGEVLLRVVGVGSGAIESGHGCESEQLVQHIGEVLVTASDKSLSIRAAILQQVEQLNRLCFRLRGISAVQQTKHNKRLKIEAVFIILSGAVSAKECDQTALFLPKGKGLPGRGRESAGEAGQRDASLATTGLMRLI